MESGQDQPKAEDRGEPTPVDDLAKRIKILRENGCRAYKDGRLELVFEAKPRAQLSLAELALAQRGATDSGVTP